MAPLLALVVGGFLATGGEGMRAANPRFERSFAAAEGWITPVERPYREELSLNGRWRFQPVALPASYRRDSGVPPALPAPMATGWSAIPLKVPSPWNVNRWTVQGRGNPDQPYQTDSVYYPSYPRAWDGAEMGWLRRTFRVPAGWGTRRLRLRFEAIAGDAEVWVNGHRVGRHFDSFLPFELDVTDAIRRNAENEVRVGVRAAWLYDHRGVRHAAFRSPYPPGSTLDHIVGIWQDVSLLGVPAVRVSDAFVQPYVGRNRLEIAATVANDDDRPRTVVVGGDVRPWINLADKGVLSAPEPRSRLGAPVLAVPPRTVTIPAHASRAVTLATRPAGRLKRWSPAAPNLYGAVLDVRIAGGTVDRKCTRFGWREFTIRGRDLLLNGEPIRLYGDLLHPFGPFVGSRRYLWSWYRMIQDMGGNAVRLHGQPHPRAALDLADEMGICVLDETALFGSSLRIDFDAPEAWLRFEAHYDGLVRRDRNHPSVFGWSAGNELFAMFLDVPEAERAPYYARLGAYARRALRLDPTRAWISCDGDETLRGAVPVWSRHYGLGVPTLPEVPGPRMVGESGGSYYAKPGELAAIAGERAYAGYRDRNEALALDLYRNVTEMARPAGLAFFSASETAWFGLEHLPFGYTDHTRPPNLTDGVLFGPYREGVPGVQPERLPPYAMTFNPGFDPRLPLYRPLPMFEAFRAAIAGKPWSLPPARPVATFPAPAPVPSVAFLGDRRGPLARWLEACGVSLTEAASDLTILDGDTIDASAASTLGSSLERLLARGGTVFVVFGPGGDPAAIARLLGSPIVRTERRATSLIPVVPDPMTAGLGLADLYFAEDRPDPTILRRGLTGSLVARGTTLLRASDTDWTLFNDRSEEEKGSNLLIYESLVKAPGAALVAVPIGRGRLLLSTVEYGGASEPRTRLWRRLMTNLGVVLGEPKRAWVLPAAFVPGTPPLWRFTTTRPPDGWNATDFDATGWAVGAGGFGTPVPGATPRTAWTSADLWLRTEFSLPAAVPNDLSLHVYHDEDVEVWINGTLVVRAAGHVQSYTIVPLTDAMRRAFRPGANTISVHCHQTAGGQFLDVGISSGAISEGGTRAYDPLRDGPKGAGPGG